MVIIRHINNQLLVAAKNRLIRYDPDSKETKVVTIPSSIVERATRKNKPPPEENAITSANTSDNEQYIVVTTSQKQVVVLQQSDLSIVKTFNLQRAASKVAFTTSHDIIVADKTGDVYLFKLNQEGNESTLLLGHLSMILDVAASACGKYIITCDRDEKIRVSHFPNSYNIQSYCLGHLEFVITIKVFKEVLISASGDGTLRIWDYKNGRQLECINTNDYVNSDDLLEDFRKSMESEKVEVTALPVTDMQIYHNDNLLIIAVSLHKYHAIQLYKAHLQSYKIEFVKNIECLGGPRAFCFGNSSLYWLDKQLLGSYDINGKECNASFDDLYLRIKDIAEESDNALTALYKRKFDNVQEYYERKKQRLEHH